MRMRIGLDVDSREKLKGDVVVKVSHLMMSVGIIQDSRYGGQWSGTVEVKEGVMVKSKQESSLQA